MEFSEAAPILHAIAMAEASDEPLDVSSTAADLEITESLLRAQVEEIEDLGLALSGLEEGLHPILLNAGRQYLARAGAPVRSLATGLAVAGDSSRTLTWDGRSAAGGRLPDGVYRMVIRGRDGFGSTAAAAASVSIDGTAPAIASASPGSIDPQGAITVAVNRPERYRSARATQTQPGYSYPNSQSISATETRLTFDAPRGGWKPGPVHVDVAASDSLGNARTTRLTFTVPGPPAPGAPGSAPRAPSSGGRSVPKPVRAFCSNRRATAVIRRRAPRACLAFRPGGSFGDGVNLTRLDWRHWGRASASAKGREIGFHLPCVRIPVRVRAYRLRAGCGGYRVYTRLKATSRYGSTTVRLRSCSGRP